jgi:predicted nuclease of predicted toxin-antitoxin system
LPDPGFQRPTPTPFWKIIVDVNTHDAVGEVFAQSGASVVWANRLYPEGTPDETIEDFARKEGRIIVSHDRQFLKMIQQRRFQFDTPASTGFGRILLC